MSAKNEVIGELITPIIKSASPFLKNIGFQLSNLFYKSDSGKSVFSWIITNYRLIYFLGIVGVISYLYVAIKKYLNEKNGELSKVNSKPGSANTGKFSGSLVKSMAEEEVQLFKLAEKAIYDQDVKISKSRQNDARTSWSNVDFVKIEKHILSEIKLQAKVMENANRRIKLLTLTIRNSESRKVYTDLGYNIDDEFSKLHNEEMFAKKYIERLREELTKIRNKNYGICIDCGIRIDLLSCIENPLILKCAYCS